MNKRLFILVAIAAFSVSIGHAETQIVTHSKTKSAVAKQPTEESVLAAFKKKYPSTTISAVHKSEIPGLFEISMGNNVGYTDGNVQYLIFGHIFDMATQTDLTQARMDEANKINFAALPFEKAIKVVKGNGARVFAVFTDPDCPYCKRLESSLNEIDNYTMYVFMFPIAQLHPESEAHADAIWCSKDQVAAWHAFMANGTLPVIDVKAVKIACVTPTQDLVGLGQNLGVQGTPTMFRQDGSRMPGALQGAQLTAWLDGKKIQMGR